MRQDAPPPVATLRRGQAGWFLLGTLGVSCVIAGEFAAWNWGLAHGGWGGLVIGLVLMAVMYFALVLTIAELASVIPTAGGGYGFARFAFGPLAGFLTGFAVAVEFVMAVAVIAVFFQSYFTALTGISGWMVPAACFLVSCGLHCLGVGAAMRVMVVLAAAALLGILLFLFAAAPHAALDRLFDIPVLNTALLGSPFIPFGLAGIWAALPFALAGFIGVESIALASEEAREPSKDVPRALVLALATLLVTMFGLLLIAPAVTGSRMLAGAPSPLVDTLRFIGDGPGLRIVTAVVNIAGLIGLAASFFSASYAYSRQIFALSRAGYLHPALAATNRFHAPWVAIVVPGAIAFALCLTSAGDQLYVLLVFAALFAYLFMLAAHIRLRRTHPGLKRPYRTPGGARTASIAFILTAITFLACFLASPAWSIAGAGLFLLAGAYFHLHARHRVDTRAPEEEFALARSAEASFD